MDVIMLGVLVATPSCPLCSRAEGRCDFSLLRTPEDQTRLSERHWGTFSQGTPFTAMTVSPGAGEQDLSLARQPQEPAWRRQTQPLGTQVTLDAGCFQRPYWNSVPGTQTARGPC